tara:strand:+ start:109 stop:585 length:477 start_codon:yes stop_codon:yes gene_type:complete
MNTLTNILTPLFIALGFVNPSPALVPYEKPVPVVQVVEIPLDEVIEPVVEVIEEEIIIKKEIIKPVVIKPVIVVVPEIVEPIIEVVEEPIIEIVIDTSKQDRFDKKFIFLRKKALKKIKSNKNSQFSSQEQNTIYTYNRDLKNTSESWEVKYKHLLIK